MYVWTQECIPEALTAHQNHWYWWVNPDLQADIKDLNDVGQDNKVSTGSKVLIS